MPSLLGRVGGGPAHPSEMDDFIVARFGSVKAADLLPRIHALEAAFYRSNANYTAPDLVTMGEQAAAEFRGLHPEGAEEAMYAFAGSSYLAGQLGGSGCGSPVLAVAGPAYAAGLVGGVAEPEGVASLVFGEVIMWACSVTSWDSSSRGSGRSSPYEWCVSF